ncbi:Rubrerythrin-2 [Peptoniphilus sp. KCTC 25270]|uniref:rubrerythrin family protein n=1 Tax=Peptoniphilus sp. KCTC 25270 TaxID=2897414 RepID=UPI001E5C49C6|nr:ferritin family protein [Peptoniphilus sp. KCTC 25270]MCD1147015.1 Rubrerythrin-2 [Peptoniphilus sp. KCTC 25270]
MNHMTQDNLRSAFGGESQAHMRYTIWADVARKEGFPNVERLFNCTADAESVHANLHFKALKDVHGDFPVVSMAGFGIGNTAENLQKGIDGEMFEVGQMYPAYIEVAKMQGEESAVKAMEYAVGAEKVHAERYEEAKKAVEAGNDLDAENILLCPVCGYITFDADEEICPICNTKSKAFVAY